MLGPQWENWLLFENSTQLCGVLDKIYTFGIQTGMYGIIYNYIYIIYVLYILYIIKKVALSGPRSGQLSFKHLLLKYDYLGCASSGFLSYTLSLSL